MSVPVAIAEHDGERYLCRCSARRRTGCATSRPQVATPSCVGAAARRSRWRRYRRSSERPCSVGISPWPGARPHIAVPACAAIGVRGDRGPLSGLPDSRASDKHAAYKRRCSHSGRVRLDRHMAIVMCTPSLDGLSRGRRRAAEWQVDEAPCSCIQGIWDGIGGSGRKRRLRRCDCGVVTGRYSWGWSTVPAPATGDRAEAEHDHDLAHQMVADVNQPERGVLPREGLRRGEIRRIVPGAAAQGRVGPTSRGHRCSATSLCRSWRTAACGSR